MKIKSKVMTCSATTARLVPCFKRGSMNYYALKPLTICAVMAVLTACQTVQATHPRPTSAVLPMNTKVRVQVKHEDLISDLKTLPAVQAAFQSIQDHRIDNVKTLIALTEIPAPPFGEDKRGQRVAELFREAGLTDVRVDEVGNVIARRPGKAGGKTIAMAAHIDTVFPIETDVKVRKEGDTYFAPGIGDNTRGVVLMLSLIKAMEAHNIQTSADLLFVGNVGEEGLGDLRGIKHLYRDGGPSIDALIAVDGGARDRLIHGGVGSHRYRVTYQGRGGHSWSSFGSANPHHALSRAVEIFARTAPRITSEGPKSSFSVGRIGGGTSINSIPFESWMEVDMRSGDVEKLDTLDAIFQKAVTEGLKAENTARVKGPGLTVDVQSVGNRPAGKASPEQPLIQQAMAAMESLGLTPDLRISSTDANIPISMGKPAITISRGGLSKGAHGLDESWQDIDSHISIQLALLIILAQAGVASP